MNFEKHIELFLETKAVDNFKKILIESNKELNQKKSDINRNYAQIVISNILLILEDNKLKNTKTFEDDKSKNIEIEELLKYYNSIYREFDKIINEKEINKNIKEKIEYELLSDKNKSEEFNIYNKINNRVQEIIKESGFY